MKKIILALALCSSLVAQAQIEDDKNCFNHLSASLNLGTNGIGFELGTTITPIIGMRAGVDFMPVVNFKKQLNYERPAVLNNVPDELLEDRYVNIPEYGAKIDINIKPFMTQGKLLFDIYPTKNSMFHFTVGAYFGSSVIAKGKCADKTIAAVELYNKDIKNGYIKAEPDYPEGIMVDLEGYNVGLNKGRAELQAKVNAVRPYVGIGFGRTVPRHRFGCKFDFGVQFWGKPQLYDRYNDCVVKQDYKNYKGEGITNDLKDALDIADKVIVYPTLKFSLVGRIL